MLQDMMRLEDVRYEQERELSFLSHYAQGLMQQTRAINRFDGLEVFKIDLISTRQKQSEQERNAWLELYLDELEAGRSYFPKEVYPDIDWESIPVQTIEVTTPLSVYFEDAKSEILPLEAGVKFMKETRDIAYSQAFGLKMEGCGEAAREVFEVCSNSVNVLWSKKGLG